MFGNNAAERKVGMQNLKDSFKTVQRLIQNIDQILFYKEKQKYYYVNTCMQPLVGSLKALEDIACSQFPDFTEQYVTVVSQIFSVYGKKDYIALEDVLQYEVKPFLFHLMAELYTRGFMPELLEPESMKSLYLQEELCGEKKKLLELSGKVEVPDSYILENTQVGLYTLRIQREETGFYMHSRQDPYLEAVRAADDIYTSAEYIEKYGMKKLVVFGLGLGYHVDRLTGYQDVEQIVVIEPDIHILAVTLHYIGLKSFADSRVRVVYDPQLKEFGKLMEEKNVNFYVYQPAVENIQNDTLKSSMKDFFLGITARKSQMERLVGNFNKNIALQDTGLCEIREQFCGKDMILLAGGPSLDECIPPLKELLKQKAPNIIVMAVGTVYKKLRTEGIIPDYCIITDAQNGMLKQIEGAETEGSQLIYLSTVDYHVPSYWNGERYIVFQKDFLYAEQYAESALGKAGEEMLVSTGGSVATTAVDIALRYGVNSLTTLGLDLAFYKNRFYASSIKGSDGKTELDKQYYDMYVPANGGGTVPTCRNLNTYRLWIEQRLAQRTESEKRIRLINASQGAVIAGMEYASFHRLASEGFFK